VFFTSEDRLTDAAPAGGGLYEFDVPTGELQLRVAGVNSEFGNSWILLGRRYGLITEDGSRLYFVSHLKLTSDAPESGGLYFLDHQHLAYALPFNEGGNPAVLPQMSADGTTLAFLSTRDLTSYESGGQSEVYLYHAGTGEVECASCSPSGAAPSGPAAFSSSPTARYPANLSTDGSRVFFETPDRLTTGDSNSSIDVYEYENHHVALISSGHGSQAERFAGASADGSDVLFSSNEALLDTDTDGGATDLYDARVGGGTPSAQPSAHCSDESCQAVVAPPPASSAGSEFVHSTGHSTGRKPKPCAKGRHRAKAGGKTKCVANHPAHPKRQRRGKRGTR
jgi:Tol biopolymer transport system component